MSIKRIVSVFAACLAAAVCVPTARAAERVDFAKDIKPILELQCVRCHGAEKPKAALRLDTRAGAIKGGDAGAALVPGKSKDSLIFKAISLPKDDDALMPPAGKGGPLPKEQITLIGNWIDEGSTWPDSEVLIARKEEVAPTGDESAKVADIHKLILSRLTITNEAKMVRYTNTIPGTRVNYRMTPIPGGEFQMGSAASEKGRAADEGPGRKVKISPFWMGQFEVTWGEFELFMYTDQERKFGDQIKTDVYVDKVSDAVTRPTKPYVEMSFGMGRDGFPAISMTQHAANKYCEWLSAKTGEFYRLPTEAEWEYACRAGTTTAYFFGDDPAKLDEYAWFEKNSNMKYQKVGLKKPNPWGLYDIHGNVAEWCLDEYKPAYAISASPTTIILDPWAKSTQPYPQVARGGSWDDTPDKLRSAARRGSNKSWKMQDPQLPKSIWYLTDAQFLGFRIVRPLKVPPPEQMKDYWNSGVELD